MSALAGVKKGCSVEETQIFFPHGFLFMKMNEWTLLCHWQVFQHQNVFLLLYQKIKAKICFLCSRKCSICFFFVFFFCSIFFWHADRRTDEVGSAVMMTTKLWWHRNASYIAFGTLSERTDSANLLIPMRTHLEVEIAWQKKKDAWGQKLKKSNGT